MRDRAIGRVTDERGAMLVQVAISILVLMSFTVYVVDYGVVWVARGQAQNAADAGALAGAISRAWDDQTDPPPVGGIVDLAARNVAEANLVWNTPAVPVTSFECPPGVSGGGCVQVDVFRNGEADSQTLPVFFGTLLGVASQGVRATATAQVRAANSTDCLKPFAILDREPNGYSLEEDYGTPLVIKDEGWPGAPGFRGFVDVGQGTGANALRDITRRCAGTVYGIGDVLPQQSGNVASLGQAVVQPNGLMALDPNAVWDPGSRTIANSCVETGTCLRFESGTTTVADPHALVSPRIIPLAVADRNVWMATQTVQIKGFLGFFVTAYDGPPDSALHGILVMRPGLLTGGYGSPDPDDEFTQVVVLVR